MKIVSAKPKYFLDIVLEILVTYEDNTTEWLTEEEYDAIKQEGSRQESK